MVNAVSSSPVRRPLATATALLVPSPKRERSAEEQQRAEQQERDHKNAKGTKVQLGNELELIFAPDEIEEIEEIEDEVRADGERRAVPPPPPSRPQASVFNALAPRAQQQAGLNDLRNSPTAQKRRMMSNTAFSSPRRTYSQKRPLVLENQQSMEQFGFHQVSFNAPRNTLPQGSFGLRNLGNTCYMNASLQAMMVFARLMQDVCSDANVTRVQVGMPAGKEALCSVLRKFWKEAGSMSGQVLSAARIKEVIGSSNAQFVGNQQEDAHEFFSTLINQLEDEYRECTKQPTGPVFQHFSLAIQHTLTCNDCGHNKVFEELFLDLSVEHLAPDLADAPALSLGSLLEHFMQTERDLEWKCPQSCPSERASLAHKLSRSPRVLLVQVKRFSASADGTTFRKIAAPVEVPEFLDVSSVALAEMKGGYLYQLRAVVVHYGATSFSGHYVCFARRNDDWFKYNDSSVQPCTKQDAYEGDTAQRNAYMMLYARVEENEDF